ncbi:GAST1 protein-like 5 [Quillaja saponaria]|uniref:GAST1 protein-like 5 n=1 Tax=Quillaja saponaria TaxID=32244 RepID=A0AAD7QFE7_QUISA|nr:GAST1 protein-like 5 [Quillaja saponaria]
MAKLALLPSAFVFTLLLAFSIQLSYIINFLFILIVNTNINKFLYFYFYNHRLVERDRFALNNVARHVIIVVQLLSIGSHVCSSATSVVPNVYVFPQALMVTKKNVHAITTGRLKKENLNVLDFDGIFIIFSFNNHILQFISYFYQLALSQDVAN